MQIVEILTREKTMILITLSVLGWENNPHYEESAQGKSQVALETFSLLLNLTVSVKLAYLHLALKGANMCKRNVQKKHLCVPEG